MKPRRAAAGVTVLVLLVTPACADDQLAASTTTGPGDTTTSSNAAAPDTTPPPTATTPAMIETIGFRGDRYCEVLLVRPGTDVPTAEVYNSYSLNDCPPELWAQLDPATIAVDEQVPAALLNGPRYWLMDRIARAPSSERVIVDFGGIEMFLAATVKLNPEAVSATPYLPSAVDRKTVFTFDAGSRVYELLTPDGDVYVMQSWSQQIDPTLDEAALSELGSRLALPDGWTFATRVLDEPLQIVTTESDAQVIQDELRNSYSLLTPRP